MSLQQACVSFRMVYMFLPLNGLERYFLNIILLLSLEIRNQKQRRMWGRGGGEGMVGEGMDITDKPFSNLICCGRQPQPNIFSK